MNPSDSRKALCVVALFVTSMLTGCLAQRPHPYNRRSFHASRELRPSDSVSRAQLARWHRKSDDQFVATATANANSPKELGASGQ